MRLPDPLVQPCLPSAFHLPLCGAHNGGVVPPLDLRARHSGLKTPFCAMASVPCAHTHLHVLTTCILMHTGTYTCLHRHTHQHTGTQTHKSAYIHSALTHVCTCVLTDTHVPTCRYPHSTLHACSCTQHMPTVTHKCCSRMHTPTQMFIQSFKLREVLGPGLRQGWGHLR